MPKVRMTDRWVTATKGTPGKHVDYYDIVERGLVLRITPKGYKSWTVRYARRSDGKIRRLTLGDIRLISLAEARKRTKEAMIEVLEGRDPQGDKQRESKVEAFNELADRYLTRYAKRKKRTWKRDQEILDRDIRPIIGAMRVSTIERHHITEILDNVEDRGVTTQVNRVHEIVRGVFRWGLEQGTIKNDPTFGMKARFKENTRTRVLKGDELALIWNSLDALPLSKASANILKLCAITGQRVGEVAGIRLSELDFKAREWHLPKERTKNKLKHMVPLSAMALTVIREALTDAGGSKFLFPSNGRLGHIEPGSISTAVGRAQKHLDIPHWSTHDLRRTLKTNLQEMKVLKEVRDRITNHVNERNKGTDGSYELYSFDNEAREALDHWSLHLSKLIAGAAEAENVVHLG